MMRLFYIQVSVKYNLISFKLTTLFRTIAEQFQHYKRRCASMSTENTAHHDDEGVVLLEKRGPIAMITFFTPTLVTF